MGMSAGDKDFAAKQLELNQFNGDDKRLDAKLHALNATRDDLPAVRRRGNRAARHAALRRPRCAFPGQAERMQAAFIAQLRRDASINTARH